MPKSPENLVVTIAGDHGSGRTTQAKLISEKFGLRYISTGELFRERAKELGVTLEEMNLIASKDDEFDRYLDKRAKDESRRRGIVLDANLSAWMAENPDIKIYLTTPLDVRVKRISERENREYLEVKKETIGREKLERERYLKYYDVDVNDLSVYDVILNTSLFSIDASARILNNVIEEYLR